MKDHFAFVALQQVCRLSSHQGAPIPSVSEIQTIEMVCLELASSTRMTPKLTDYMQSCCVCIYLCYDFYHGNEEFIY